TVKEEVAAAPVTAAETPKQGLMKPEEAYREIDALLQDLPMSAPLKKELQGKDNKTKALALVDIAMHKMNSSKGGNIALNDAAFYFKTVSLLAQIADSEKEDQLFSAILIATVENGALRLKFYVDNSAEAKELIPSFRASASIILGQPADKVTFLPV